jgi:hypothetical protein
LVGLWMNMQWWTAMPMPVFHRELSGAEYVAFTGFISVYSAAIIWLCCLQIEWRRFTWLNVWLIIVIAIHLASFIFPPVYVILLLVS